MNFMTSWLNTTFKNIFSIDQGSDQICPFLALNNKWKNILTNATTTKTWGEAEGKAMWMEG